MGRWKRLLAHALTGPVDTGAPVDTAATLDPGGPLPVAGDPDLLETRAPRCEGEEARTVHGRVVYSDAVLLQVSLGETAMGFYFLDDHTVFFNAVAGEDLDRCEVELCVQGDQVTSVVVLDRGLGTLRGRTAPALPVASHVA